MSSGGARHLLTGSRAGGRAAPGRGPGSTRQQAQGLVGSTEPVQAPAGPAAAGLPRGQPCSGPRGFVAGPVLSRAGRLGAQVSLSLCPPQSHTEISSRGKGVPRARIDSEATELLQEGPPHVGSSWQRVTQRRAARSSAAAGACWQATDFSCLRLRRGQSFSQCLLQIGWLGAGRTPEDWWMSPLLLHLERGACVRGNGGLGRAEHRPLCP